MTVLTQVPKNKAELQKQLELINEILEESFEVAQTFKGVDKRGLAVAKTEIETGFMWFRKSLEKHIKL